MYALPCFSTSFLAGRGVEDEKQAGVGGAGDHLALRDGGRGDHPAAARVVAPLLLAGRRIERVEIGVPASGVDDAVHHRRRRLESDLVVDQRIFAAVEAPFLLAGGRVDRVEVAVPAAEEHDAVGVRGRCVDHVARLEFPAQRAGRGIERVDVAVAAAEVHGSATDDRARQEDVERVGNRLVPGQKAVDSFGLESPLAAGREFPARRAGAHVEGVELAVVAADVYKIVRRRPASPATGPPVLRFHSSRPSAAFTAYTLPSSLPKKMTPSW